MMDWNMLIWEPVRQNGEKLAGLLPHLINALYILAFGWVLAFITQFIFRKILKAAAFNKIAEKTGIARVYQENGMTLIGEMLG